MNIPSDCHMWSTAITSGDASQERVLRNVREEACLPDGAEAAFFGALARRGPYASAAHALLTARDVVKEFSDLLTCRRQAVPGDMFAILFRIEFVDILLWRVPDACASIGIKYSEQLFSVSDEDLALLTDEYEGEVRLGNELEIVWVSDFSETEPLLADLNGLIARLGLLLAKETKQIILCVYARSGVVQSLHVPSALDAIDKPQFRVTMDCSAIFGLTECVNDSNVPGLREAVHRGCGIRPIRWCRQSL